MTELFEVDATVPVAASSAAVWEFLSDPNDTGLSGVIPGSSGVPRPEPGMTEVGHRFTEFFADPDTGEKIPCTWETVSCSPRERHLRASAPISGDVAIELWYSLTSTSDGTVSLRRRMTTRLPVGRTLTDGWFRRLGDQRAAEETTRRIADRIAEKAAGYQRCSSGRGRSSAP